LMMAASLEQQSSHPIADAILGSINGQSLPEVYEQQEIAGKGLKGMVGNREVLAGNRDLLTQHQVAVTNGFSDAPYTYIHVAVDGLHAGTISIADRVKDDSKRAIRALKEKGIDRMVMLSGDHPEVVAHVAKSIGVDEAYGGLLPDEKYKYVQESLDSDGTVGFVGDGVNDAPVIALADVGIAMGGIVSDATIETADVVVQTDQPSKLPLAIDIAIFTPRIVWQNIGFALGIKLLVMGLATIGMATMWEAIFADVGVALITIANAIRIQHKYTPDSSTSVWSAFTETDTLSESEPAPSCCDSH